MVTQEFLKSQTDISEWDNAKIVKALQKWKLTKEYGFSASQFGSYRECPRKWALEKICKIKYPKTFLGTVLGNCIHDLLENRYSNREGYDKLCALDDKELKKVIVNDVWFRINKEKKNGIDLSWSEARYPDAKKHFAKGDWYTYLVEESADRVVEWIRRAPWYFDAEAEKDFRFDDWGFPIRGRMDILGYNESGAYVVADYKSTYSHGYFDAGKYDMQEAIYLEASDCIQCELIVMTRMKRADKDRVKVITHNWTPEEMEAKKQEIIGIYNRIKQKQFAKKDAEDDFCSRVCGYRPLCFGEEAFDVSQDVIEGKQLVLESKEVGDDEEDFWQD